jgi:phage shock protein A
MADGIAERLSQLEDAVRRTGEVLARLREENDRLRRDHRRLEDEKKHVVAQIDAILRDIAKLDLERPANG